MVEDRRKDYSDPKHGSEEPPDPTGRSGGSGIIFALVAIALVLAIVFFYLTKDRDYGPANDAVTNAANSADSAAYIVGDAASNAANALRNRD